MKNILTIIALLVITGIGYSQENEKRIKFNKGTLKICSTSNMKISGYDGDEVIIKSLNSGTRYVYYNFRDKTTTKIKSSDSTLVRYGVFTDADKKKKLENGLKPLGNKSVDPSDNLYLDIKVNPGELIISDYKSSNSGQYEIKNSFPSNNKFELLIPNSIKLLWNTENCAKTNSNTFYIVSDSKPWELSNFRGEAEISASYGSINLIDVSGPVIANTIGGNIKVVFDNVSPTNLYSLISNDGYIDVEFPTNANINLDAVGYRILSDIEFKVLSEDVSELDGIKRMKLQLNSGAINMKLDAGSGSIYLRKNK